MFHSRFDAGRRLAERLKEEGIGKNPLILALAPGGVIVAASVAGLLDTPIKLAKKGVSGLQNLKEKSIIIVDDGQIERKKISRLIKNLRKEKAAWITVCLPVYPFSKVRSLKKIADLVIALFQPKIFFDTKEYYSDFPEVTPALAKKALKLV